MKTLCSLCYNLDSLGVENKSLQYRYIDDNIIYFLLLHLQTIFAMKKMGTLSVTQIIEEYIL